MPLSISITPYSTAQAVWDAYIKSISEDAGVDLTECSMEAVSAEGDDVSVPVQDMLGFIERMGAWGWVEEATNEIHIWFEEGCSPRRKLQVLGHELGHVLTDNPFEPGGQTEDQRVVEDEQRADLVSDLILQIVETAGLLEPEVTDEG